MKVEFSSMWRVAMALMLALSFGLIMSVPVVATDQKYTLPNSSDSTATTISDIRIRNVTYLSATVRLQPDSTPAGWNIPQTCHIGAPHHLRRVTCTPLYWTTWITINLIISGLRQRTPPVMSPLLRTLRLSQTRPLVCRASHHTDILIAPAVTSKIIRLL